MTDSPASRHPSRLARLLDHAARPFSPRATNPSFSIDARTLDAELDRLRADRTPLARPVVAVSGWRAPRTAAHMTAARLASLTSGNPDDFARVSLFAVRSIAQGARAIIDAVERSWPSDDPAWTREVDVVAISMGGLASRLAAAPREGFRGVADGLPPKRLRIGRLFTLATPHRGASLAQVVAPDACARSMLPGSAFLQALDDALAREPIDIIPYTRLRDGMVGATHTAPPGMTPIWLDGSPVLSHLSIMLDRRILLDVALRLRNERPIAGAGDPPPHD